MNSTVKVEDQVLAHLIAIQELLQIESIIPEKGNYAFRIPLKFGDITDKKELSGGNHFFMSGQVIVYTPKKDAIIEAGKWFEFRRFADLKDPENVGCGNECDTNALFELWFIDKDRFPELILEAIKEGILAT